MFLLQIIRDFRKLGATHCDVFAPLFRLALASWHYDKYFIIPWPSTSVEFNNPSAPFTVSAQTQFPSRAFDMDHWVEVYTSDEEDYIRAEYGIITKPRSEQIRLEDLTKYVDAFTCSLVIKISTLVLGFYRLGVKVILQLNAVRPHSSCIEL